MQRGLRVITLQEAIKKSPILLSQYWKNEWLDCTIIISYIGGSNNIFTDCTYNLELIINKKLFDHNLNFSYPYTIHTLHHTISYKKRIIISTFIIVFFYIKTQNAFILKQIYINQLYFFIFYKD